MAWKAAALLFCAFLMVLGPAGCSRKAGDEGNGGGQTDSAKPAPVAPVQDSLAKPQSPSGVIAAPQKSDKSEDEEDKEEPETEPDDD